METETVQAAVQEIIPEKVPETDTEKVFETTVTTVTDEETVREPVTPRTGILLSFDDEYYDSWETYLDLFDTYNAKVTFFVQGKLHPFWIEAANRGHDIGYHTLNHKDLRELSGEEFFIETIEPVETFKQEGVTFSAFAYPFGFFQSWMHEELLQSYGTVRGYGTRFIPQSEDEIYKSYVYSRSIDNIIFPDDKDFEETIVSMFSSIKEGQILALTTHAVSNAPWAITPQRLIFVLKTANDFGLTFYRFSDFAGGD